MRTSLVLVASILALGGCATEGSDSTELVATPGVGPIDKDPVIYYGSAPDSPEHDAVVGLHWRSGSRVYTDPFCTGTLIDTDVVLTAAHCLDIASDRSSSYTEMSTSNLVIYVGDDPSVDLTSHAYTVSDLQIYSSYNRRSIVDDMGLVRLSTPITEAVDPVPPLPASLELTNADAGIDLNFAGFGYTETGSYGNKMQVTLPLEGLGCVVSPYCSTTAHADTQISYAQDTGGPCSGDSGGPAFVTRSGTVYVAGVTSYGDARCIYYGVSTKVDAFESFWSTWISGGDTGTVGDGGSTAPYCGDGTCDADESCDGRRSTTSCPEDCAGRTSGPRFLQYCFIGDTCYGRGCSRL